MKYVDTAIVFDEVPGEITLAINISGCKIHCPDCHSKYLWEDIGKGINEEELYKLVESNPGITCICFMGGKEEDVYMWTYWLKKHYPKLKTAWYTGQESVKKRTLNYLNYVKTGPYKKEFGPLNNRNTNQRFYHVQHNKQLNDDGEFYTVNLLVDETNKFWKHENSSM